MIDGAKLGILENVVDCRDSSPYPRWAKILHMGLVLAVTFELYNSLAALWFANFQWFPLHVATGIFLTFWLVLCWALYLGSPWGRALLWSWFFPSRSQVPSGRTALRLTRLTHLTLL